VGGEQPLDDDAVALVERAGAPQEAIAVLAFSSGKTSA
jgi:hypothetical protein